MDEEMILPNDFESEGEAATPQAEDNIETTDVTEVEETNPTEETQEQTEIKETTIEQAKIKIKYNHEERELTLEEATLLAQKGMNYDKTIDRLKALENDPRLSFIEQQANKYSMTSEQYIEAVRQQEEQEQLTQLLQANIPEEYAREMLESRKFRNEYLKQQEEHKQRQQEEQKQNDEVSEFIDNFQDVKIADVPQEVWDYKQKTGKSLTDSMFWHENQQLKTKIKVLEQNLSNKSKAPVGSITSHGSNEVAEEDDFLKGFNSF